MNIWGGLHRVLKKDQQPGFFLIFSISFMNKEQFTPGPWKMDGNWVYMSASMTKLKSA